MSTAGLPPRTSAGEMARRHKALADLTAAEGLDGLLVYGQGRFQADLLWATDWPGGREGLALFPLSGPPALLVEFFNHLPTARSLSALRDIRWAGADDGRALVHLLAERGLSRGRLGIAGDLPLRHVARLQSLLPELLLVDVTAAFRSLRLIKSEEELARLRRAAALTDQALTALAQGLRPGLAEEDLPALVEAPILAGGGQPGIHYIGTMPRRGPFLSVPAQYPQGRRLSPDDVIITEITAAYWGYPGQAHRTFSFAPPDPVWSDLETLAEEVFQAVLDVLRPGATAEDVVQRADRIHARGHTIVDDLLHGVDQLPPILRTHATAHAPYPKDFVFQAGMVVVVQPNPVAPDGRGLQFGETVLIGPTGPIPLHDFPRRWIVVD